MRYFALSIFVFINLFARAQKIELIPITREVIISTQDSTIRANVLIKEEKLVVNDRKNYHWHNKGQININKGGYSGELLHGEYLVFDKQKRMITQGTFEYGLLDGKWKYWYQNGNLKSVQTYQNGILHGEQMIYDNEGTLVTYNNFKDGKLVIEEEKIFGKEKKENPDQVPDTIPATPPTTE